MALTALFKMRARRGKVARGELERAQFAVCHAMGSLDPKYEQQVTPVADLIVVRQLAALCAPLFRRCISLRGPSSKTFAPPASRL